MDPNMTNDKRLERIKELNAALTRILAANERGCFTWWISVVRCIRDMADHAGVLEEAKQKALKEAKR